MMRGILLTVVSTLCVTAALAEEPVTVNLTIREHRFVPAELHVPAGRPLLLRVTNADAGPEEFESVPLKIEKVVAGGQTITIRLRPLAPGRFAYFGEFHADTAKGTIVAE